MTNEFLCWFSGVVSMRENKRPTQKQWELIVATFKLEHDRASAEDVYAPAPQSAVTEDAIECAPHDGMIN